MTSSSKSLRPGEIEAGSNIFELIEFSLERDLGNGKIVMGRYGVNVAKVREVIRVPKIDPLASTTEGIVGVFELRGVPIPIVSLNVVLGDPRGVDPSPGRVVVAEFSQRRAGFLVRETKRIRRVSWDKVLPPSSDAGSCITGMILLGEGDFLYILDLERILNGLEVKSTGNSPGSHLSVYADVDSIASELTRSDKASGKHLLLVDDSKLVLVNVSKALGKIGYRVSTASNGAQALELLKKTAQAGQSSDQFDCVVTDVEMPMMDGLTLTSEIRKTAKLQHLPVILHTSLGGMASKEAGLRVGANSYVVKNDLGTLLSTLDDTLSSGSRMEKS